MSIKLINQLHLEAAIGASFRMIDAMINCSQQIGDFLAIDPMKGLAGAQGKAHRRWPNRSSNMLKGPDTKTAVRILL